MAELTTSRYSVLPRNVTTLLMCLCLGSLSALNLAAQQTADIEGQVRTSDGQVPPAGTTVGLETSEGEPAGQTPVDSAGNYEFRGIRKIQYVLTVTAPGFATTSQTINVEYAANTYFCNITLRPALQAKSKASSLPNRTDTLAPRKAKKEYERGARALRKRDLKAAESHFQKAISQYSCYARARTDLASVLIAQQRLRAAQTQLEKAQACDADFLDAYIELGLVLNQEKEFEKSSKVLQEGLRRSPASWPFYFQLGVAEAGMGRYAQAEQSYRKVLDFNPTPPPDLFVKLADLYINQGAYTQAYTQMQKYLEVAPQGRFAPRIRQVMAQMLAAGVVSTAQSSPHP